MLEKQILPGLISKADAMTKRYVLSSSYIKYGAFLALKKLHYCNHNHIKLLPSLRGKKGEKTKAGKTRNPKQKKFYH